MQGERAYFTHLNRRKCRSSAEPPVQDALPLARNESLSEHAAFRLLSPVFALMKVTSSLPTYTLDRTNMIGPWL